MFLASNRRERILEHTVQPTDEDTFGSLASMKTGNRVSQLLAKLAVLWIALLVLPFAERTLLGSKTYYFLYVGLGLVFVVYGLTIRSIYLFLRSTRREPVYANR